MTSGDAGETRENALEVGDAMQSGVLTLISSAQATPVIVNC